MEEVFSLADDVRIQAFDTSLPGTSKLVSANNKHFQMSGVALHVLECVDLEARSTSEIGERFRARHGYNCPLDTLEEVLGRLAKMSVLLVSADSKLRPDEKKQSWWRKAFSGYFALKVDLFPSSLLRPLTSRIHPVFRPIWLGVGIPLMLVLQVAFCVVHFRDLLHKVAALDSSSLACVIVFNYLGLFIHELGHAAACVQCGIMHGNIGVGLYLVFPAFYTDVSQAWALPRKRRVVVDGAGIYVTLLLASIASLCFLLTGSLAAGILAVLYDLTVFTNLNPFVRMDGYWLLSDALGIQNMMQANRELSMWLIRRRKETSKQPAVLKLPTSLRNIYLFYYFLFVVFVAYFGIAFYGWYLPRFIAGYPELLRQTAAHFGRSVSWWTSAKALVRFVFSSAPLLALVIYGSRLSIGTIRRLTKAAKDSDQPLATLRIKENSL